tara:strand:- start:4545 stop:4838 length:294 start_codon:yes stop_codon:yes gene_type:complete
MVIIADYYIYNLGEVTCKKNIAELNLSNGLIKIHSKLHSTNSKPELIVNIFDDSIRLYLEDNEFELSEDGSYYTTFLSFHDKEVIDELYLKYKHLFN